MSGPLPRPALRLLALCAVYLPAMAAIALYWGAPLDEALAFPFITLVPLGVIPLGLGLLVLTIMDRLGAVSLLAHVLGGGALALVSLMLVRTAIAGPAALMTLPGPPYAPLLAFAAAGGLAGAALWAIRRRMRDLG